jgi:cellulose biosynthesis protein BcsQ
VSLNRALGGVAMSDKHESGIGTGIESPPDAAPNRDVAALFSNLHLNPAQYQPFARRRPAGITEKAIEIPSPAKGVVPSPAKGSPGGVRIGVFSPIGGAGTSTLVASLGSILCELGQKILLVDTSQWQSLVFHFGASESRSGTRTFSAPGSHGLKIHILACGASTFQVSDLDSLSLVALVDCVLLDLGGLLGKELELGLQKCDSLVVPLLPDSSALRMANEVRLLLGNLGATAPRVTFVLNKMDDSSDAANVQVLLSRELGPHLFPSVILQQVEVHDASAVGVALPYYAPEAQASSVCHELVGWLQIHQASLVSSALRWSEE